MEEGDNQEQLINENERTGGMDGGLVTDGNVQLDEPVGGDQHHDDVKSMCFVRYINALRSLS